MPEEPTYTHSLAVVVCNKIILLLLSSLSFLSYYIFFGLAEKNNCYEFATNKG